MTDETEKTETVNHITENLESVGQMIIGGIEEIGGILTGDPIAQAEGAFNVEAGVLHQESNRVLDATDETAESADSKSEKSNQSAE